MINVDKLINNFEDSSELLILRGVEKSCIEKIKELYLKRKKLITLINNLRSKKNNFTKDPDKEEAFFLKKKIKENEKELNLVREELGILCNSLPNIPSKDVPNENFVTKVKNSDLLVKNSLSYEEIIEKTDFVNFKKATKMSSSKFVIYNEKGTKILHSLINFMLSENRKNGYSLVSIPYLVNKDSLYNTGQLPKFFEDIFKIENTNLALIPTSEVSLINIYSKEIIKEEDLPIKISSYSPCFRAEAGSAGKENKGLIRLHQFNKVEVVKITKPESSYEELDLVVENVCSILEKLEITYRIINLSFKELGISSAKTYDIEIWMPNSKKWIEISSCSNCEDFQSNRSKIRGKIKNKNVVLHTINGSSLAIDRLIACLVEYYYNEEKNEIIIPSALNKFYSLI